MNNIKITSCRNCPFYDEEIMYCVASSGMFLDLDLDTEIDSIPENCPLPIIVFVGE